jgi:deoxyribonuclease-2
MFNMYVECDVGVFAHRNEKGFYLMHSQPKYPTTNPGLFSGLSNTWGQIFICVSLSEQSRIELVAKHLQQIKARVYAVNEKGPAWNDRISKRSGKKKLLVSRGGRPFILFSKEPNDPIDIWSEQVAYGTQGPLLVLSWRKGSGGKINSVCPKDPKNSVNGGGSIEIEDVRKLRYETEGDLVAEFSGSQDHGKWAVSKYIEDEHFCIGDLNRIESQKKSGGGVICMKSHKVASAFRRMVIETECDPEEASTSLRKKHKSG